jgi:hypothetical protein
MKPLAFHAWLEEERAIPRSLLLAPRFAGRIKVDFRANAVFPHADQDGPCGYEIKNQGFTGFARGGDKGLWLSAARAGDTALVIAESGIDALSHAALHPDEAARYATTWVAMNLSQPALLRAAIERMGQGARLVMATDNDPGGRALARESGREDLRLVRDLPAGAVYWTHWRQQRRLMMQVVVSTMHWLRVQPPGGAPQARSANRGRTPQNEQPVTTRDRRIISRHCVQCVQ